MSDVETAPLIVTARLDGDSFARLDGLRRTHFPAGRNHLPAHLTLFHHLPGDDLEAVVDAAREAWPGTPLLLAFPRVRLLGRGVAFDVEAAELRAVRTRIARRFEGALTPQDAQAWRPHVTVQNKVEPEEARELAASLQAEVPFTGSCEGLLVWRYLGGPWRLEAQA